MWPTGWLSPDWCSVLQQLVVSQVYLLQLMPAQPTSWCC